MRIGMILDESFPPDPRVENEARTLIDNKYEVFLFCFRFNKKISPKENIKGIHVNRFFVSKTLWKLSALAYSIPIYHLILFLPLFNFINKNKIQRLHIHDLRIARVVFWVNYFFNLKITLDLHENRPEIMKFYPHMKKGLSKMLIKPRIWKEFELKYIKKADQLITVTPEASEYYTSKLKTPKNSKFIDIPNTVHKSFYVNHEFKISEIKNQFRLLYLGDTGARRGLLTVLKSLLILKDKIPNIKVIIVGDSSDINILKTFTSKNNLNSFVEFKGFQPFEKFQEFIKNSEVGICPIHQNIHHNTTYANKVFQYMALGKPVLVSDCLSQANIVRKFNSGLIFESENVNDFTSKTLALYKNKVNYKNMSINARKCIENEFNWEEKSKKLLEIYD